MELGRENPSDHNEEFCMTVLGLRLSRRANAVSALHGEVSRAMWTRSLSRQRRRTQCRSATSPTACTCRPGWRRKCSGSTTAISGPAGTRHSGEARDLGRNRERRRRRALGNPPQPEIAAAGVRAPPARSNRPSVAANRRKCCKTGPRAQSGRADHRLRAPLRHLQAGQPDSGRHRTAGLDGE